MGSLEFTRRGFLRKGLAAPGAIAATVVATSGAGWAEESQTMRETPRVPLKIGHRAASMKMVGDFDVFKVAREMPGLMGVELQVTGGNPNLRDWDAVRHYKREANRWGMMIPSLAGIWDKGVSMLDGEAAKENIEQAAPGVELLGKERICQVHVKNGEALVGEPGLVDWAAAFEALNEIGYDGWYVFETQHDSPQALVEDTEKNIAFMQAHCEMPVG